MSSRTSTQITHLKNPLRLFLLRLLAWLIVGMSAYVVFINLPIFFNYVIENSKFPYASPVVIAWIRTIIRRFGELLFFIPAILILLRSSDPKAILIAAFSTALAATIGGSYIEVVPYVDNLGLAITFSVTVIAASFGILLLCVLPNGEFFPKYSRFLIILIALSEAVRVFISSFAYGSSLIPYLMFIPLFAVGGLGIWAQMRRYRDGSAVYRQQFKWIIFGAGAVLLGIALTLSGYFVLPPEFRILSAGLDEVGGIILALAVIFALTRYRLYDIDLFINRSLVYIGVFVGLAALFAGIVLGLQLILPSLIGLENNAPVLLAATVFVAMLFDPTRRQVQHWIDRRIYHFRFDLNQLAQGNLAKLQTGGLTGQTVAGFQLLDVIGRGGMGEVYRAMKDGRMAAIKVIADSSSSPETALRRFEREAKLTEAYQHPNIVHLYAHGNVDNLAYLALEYLDGITLDDYISQKERLPLEEARQILLDIAKALMFLHENGLVHRDIKPSNIMLRKLPDGKFEAVLMDLGLAKLINDKTSVTGTDAIGTIAYMSPEQIQEGRNVDARSDIYSLGVMAYQMLTGELPFQGSAGRILFGHLNQPAPDAQKIVPDLPLEVALAIQIAMEKSSEDRFQELHLFLKALGVLPKAA